MASLRPIFEKLGRAQQRMLRAADTIPEELWRTSPREGAWSGAEVIAHVMTIERTVIGAADRILQKHPRRIPLLKRFHLPFLLAEIRIVRLKTPIPVDTALVRGKESMLAEMREVRGRTLAFIEETKTRDLHAYRWRHPFLGSLNAYEWFSLLASHQIRHEKQMLEIAAELRRTPAAASSLQK
jgi:hypothetical protein